MEDICNHRVAPTHFIRVICSHKRGTGFQFYL